MKAKEFIVVREEKELIKLFKSEAFNHSHLILGGGSNVLLTNDFNGLVIKIDIKGKSILKEDENSAIIEAGAGENWHELVLYALDQELAGLENLSLIPGTVGAAPMQNIGAYGVEIKDVFECLYAMDKENGKIKKFNKDECQFGYRTSIFKTSLKGRFIITKVCLKLTKHAIVNTSYGAISETLNLMGVKNPNIKDVSDAVIQIRSSKLPNPEEIGNAGSFFKNPIISLSQFQSLKKKYPKIPSYPIDERSVKVPAAWLIETAGWKGKNFKNTGVHEKQALVLVNRGAAKGEEVQELSHLILNDVSKKFDILLDCEVNVI